MAGHRSSARAGGSDDGRSHALPRHGAGRRRRADPHRQAGAGRRSREPRRGHGRGNASASCASSSGSVARRTLCAAIPVPPHVRLPRGRASGSGPIRTPTRTYDLLVVSDCATLDRVGAVGDRHRDLFDRLPRVVIDHHASNEALAEADWIEPDAAATCEMVALLATCLGIPLESEPGARDRVDGRHRDGHRDVRASERDATDTGGVGGPAGGRGAALRDLPAAVPLEAGRATAPLRPRPRSAGDASTRGGSSRRRCSTPISRRSGPRRRTPKASSTCWRRRMAPRWRSCSRRPARRHGSASGPSPVASMRPS